MDSSASHDRSNHTVGRTITNDNAPYTPGLKSSNAANASVDSLDLRASQEAANSLKWDSELDDEKSMGMTAMQQSLLYITPAPPPADDGLDSLKGEFCEVDAFEVPAPPPRARQATFSM